MDIYNTDTGKTVTFKLTDERGTDWSRDFIGRCEDVSYNDDEERYEADNETIEYWIDAVQSQQAFDDRVAELEDEYGSDRVNKVLYTVTGCEFNDYIAYANEALDEAFGEQE